MVHGSFFDAPPGPLHCVCFGRVPSHSGIKSPQQGFQLDFQPMSTSSNKIHDEGVEPRFVWQCQAVCRTSSSWRPKDDVRSHHTGKMEMRPPPFARGRSKNPSQALGTPSSLWGRERNTDEIQIHGALHPALALQQALDGVGPFVTQNVGHVVLTAFRSRGLTHRELRRGEDGGVKEKMGPRALSAAKNPSLSAAKNPSLSAVRTQVLNRSVQ